MPCLAENVLAALVIQMLRAGTLAPDDLLAAAGTLDADEAAFLEALIVEAAAPADGKAALRRRMIRLVQE